MHPIRRYLTDTGQTQTQFAEQLGVTQGAVAQWIMGRTCIAATRCSAIERATDGAVTRYELRPDIFGPAPEPKEDTRHAA